MTHRERVLAALNHQEVDRVPVDLGATRDSSIVKEEYLRLKEYLGINGNRPIRLVNRMMQVVEPEEKVLEYFDVDLRGVGPGPPEKGGDKELGFSIFSYSQSVVSVEQRCFPVLESRHEQSTWRFLNPFLEFLLQFQ